MGGIIASSEGLRKLAYAQPERSEYSRWNI